MWGSLPEVPQRAVCSSGSLDLQAEVLLSIEVASLGKIHRWLLLLLLVYVGLLP